MATVVHAPVSNIVPTSAVRTVAPVAPWVLESLLMLIATIVSVAAFAAGYQIG